MRHLITLAAFVPMLLATTFAIHCSTSSSSSGVAGADAAAGGDAGVLPTSGKVPTNHRAAAETCTAPRPPSGTVGDSDAGACKVDADCKTGKNGRCVYGGDIRLVCTYDECAADTDCGKGVCSCRSEAHANANVCFRGNCIVDGDCAGGGYCSPSGSHLNSSCLTNVPPGSLGYFCHTPKDACIDNADCKDGSCLFSVEEARWACVELRCTN